MVLAVIDEQNLDQIGQAPVVAMGRQFGCSLQLGGQPHLEVRGLSFEAACWHEASVVRFNVRTQCNVVRYATQRLFWGAQA